MPAIRFFQTMETQAVITFPKARFTSNPLEVTHKVM
jgi:hypothetical protein